MTAFIRLVTALSRLCGVLAALMVLTSVLVVCQMVVTRYGLRASTTWQTEFVTYLLIAATLIGSPYVLLTRGHVNIDLIPLYLGHRGRLVLAVVSALIAFAFCLLLSWLGVAFWYEAWHEGWHSDTIWSVPLWIPYLALPVGFSVLSLQYLADLLSLLAGHDMPFGIAPEKTL